jgi:hypothetical protein
MMLTDLKTAAEVREHARKVQRRINERRASWTPEPLPLPPDHDKVPPPPPPSDAEPVIVAGYPIRTVFAIAGDHFGFSLADVIGGSRISPLVLPRQIGCFVAWRLGFSFLRIGRAILRDHSTAGHSCKTIEQRIRDDVEIAKAVEAIGRKSAAVFQVEWRSILPEIGR